MPPESRARPLLRAGLALAAAACGNGWSGAPPGISVGPAASAPRGELAPAVADAASPPRDASPDGASRDAASEDATTTAPPRFPAGTLSLRVREQAHVLAAPADGSAYIGKVTRGTRVAFRRVVPAEALAPSRRRARPPCGEFVEIEPRGYLCLRLLAPSHEPALGRAEPQVATGELAPARYYRVLVDGTVAHASAEAAGEALATGDGGAPDAGAAEARRLTTEVMVTGGERVEIAGRTLLATSHGLVDERALARLWPSPFSGVDLRAPGAPALPFGWVHAPRFGQAPLVRSEPSRDSPRVRRAKRRELVPVLEERDAHVRVGPGEWIERGGLRVARAPSPPVGAPPGAAFIDVDLDEQVLVAHDGAAPRFATLISTGKPRHRTPPGLYRILAKAATTDMAGPEDHPRRYEVAGVPWALRFHERGLYLHAAYWHDAFGAVISHGCVNLAPRDARFLFEWAAPTLPPGWSEIEVSAGEGLLVRIHDREHPDPAAPGDARGGGP